MFITYTLSITFISFHSFFSSYFGKEELIALSATSAGKIVSHGDWKVNNNSTTSLAIVRMKYSTAILNVPQWGVFNLPLLNFHRITAKLSVHHRFTFTSPSFHFHHIIGTAFIDDTRPCCFSHNVSRLATTKSSEKLSSGEKYTFCIRKIYFVRKRGRLYENDGVFAVVNNVKLYFSC